MNQKSSSPKSGMIISSNTWDSARRIDREKIQFVFQNFLGKKMNDIVNETDEWIRRGQGEDGQHRTPETCHHRDLFIGMMNGIPISSKEPKGGKAPLLQDADRNAGYFARFKPPDTSFNIGPASGNTCNLEKWSRWPKRTGMNWQSKLRTCILYRSIQSWKDVPNSRGELKKGGAHMHVHADDSSVKMMMDPTSSANDIGVFFGILWDRPWKSKKYNFGCSYSQSLRDLHSASTSTLCSWKILKLCSDSGRKTLSKGMTFAECLACIQRKIDGRG